MTHRLRVLVADDHGPMLRALVHLLSAEYEVVAAVCDGAAAVLQAAAVDPDVLVLDIAMPGVNGMAAAARLKACGSTAKIVFVTNMRERDLVTESEALGTVGFVVKDDVVVDLLPAVRSVLEGKPFVSPSAVR